MIELHFGNVLLKPSHRRQILASLKRSTRIGERLGRFILTITMHRIGKNVEVRARVQDAVGSFNCRSRRVSWRDAMRDLVQALAHRLHDQRLRIIALR